MARKQMVSRTIVTTKVNVLCVDIVTAQPSNKELVLPGVFKTEKKMMDAVGEILNSESIKAVHIISNEEVETLYGMAEQDFINHAVVLDKDTRKEIATEDTATVNPVE